MHEIVTLQLGQQANYIGTHFWNTQESYFTYGSQDESPVDHDIHFRPGIGTDGTETYTPRTLIYDLKGAFGTLRRENALYSLSDDQSSESQQTQWPGAPNILREPAIPQSTYQQSLDSGLEPPPLSTSTVRYWSDYNRVFYHPRSLVQINDFELNSTLMPFERWDTGEDLFESLDREHDLLDRDLRPFLEECDQIQGLQVWAGADDAWGGFAARYLERIRDELGKTSVWVWACEDGGARRARAQQMQRTMNTVRSAYHISPLSSLYIPITTMPGRGSPEYITGLDPASKWHTSALQLAGLETASLPSRLRKSDDSTAHATLDELESTISNDGKRRVAKLSFDAADPSSLTPSASNDAASDPRITNGHSAPTAFSTARHDGEETFALVPDTQDIDLLPQLQARPSRSREGVRSVYGQIQSLRGKWLSGIEIDEQNIQSRDKRFASAGPRTKICQTDLLMPKLDSYPDIFFGGKTSDGKLAVRTSVSTGVGVKVWLKECERLAGMYAPIEEREALVDGLGSLREEYEEGFEFGSDDSDEE